MGHKMLRRHAIVRAKNLTHLGAHLKSRRAYARPQPSQGTLWQWQRLVCHFQNTHPCLACQPPPARMGGSHHRASGVCQQHGQAIGHHDGAGHSTVGAHTGVKAPSIGGVWCEMDHLCAVHLLQKHRPRTGRLGTNGRLQRLPVGGHGTGVIAHMVAQVQMVVRRVADTAAARRAQGVHMGRRRPTGHQPVKGHGRHVRQCIGRVAHLRQRTTRSHTPFAMNTLFAPHPTPTVPVQGTDLRFPVHRIYCVGRNYEEHAKEMGFAEREAPFFFLKPADAVLPVEADQTVRLPYPSLTSNLHHEVELVVAIGQGGRNIAAAQALGHVYGYAVGLDMTRRDLQAEMKKQGRPWSIAKGFDHSAPMGPITPAAQAGAVDQAAIWLRVNGAERQNSHVHQLIWNIAETIAHLSAAWELQPGDLIFTGTPAGVGAVVRGDRIEAGVDGLQSIAVQVD